MTSDNCVGQTDSAAARMVSPRCEFESSSEIREQRLRSMKTENARGEIVTCLMGLRRKHTDREGEAESIACLAKAR